MHSAPRPVSSAALLLASTWLLAPAAAATPSVQQALRLEPVQSKIQYQQPSGEEISKCKLEPDSGPRHTGWRVLDQQGQTLRRFLDTNNDKKIDRWCYYHRGIEVYRDIDTDFNGKADQYRWLGTAGSRWGLDQDEDGQVERWKMISPEEVTAEVVAAIQDRNAARFQAVLLQPNELQQLGMGDAQSKDLKQRIEAAKAGFDEYARRQATVKAKSRWLHFGATRPGVIPEGTDGSSKDLLIYDNVAAVIENEGQHDQLIVGTLVHLGQGWRVIDLPQENSAGGFFYTSLTDSVHRPANSGVSLDERMQELLNELEQLDQKLNSAEPDALAQLNAQRAGVLEQLAEQAGSAKEQDTWMRQFADSVSAAAQSGDYPDGVERLRAAARRLAEKEAPAELRAYVQFRYLTADYGQKLQQPEADFAKIQDSWLNSLKTFVKTYPKVEDAAEAMLQLAIAEEFSGQEKQAASWYQRILGEFPDTKLAAKAAGAKRRLESVGKSITLQGKSPDGTPISLDRYRGRAVLIHYWATWCQPCKQDIKTIRQLQAKFPASKFTPIGVNLDQDRQALTRFLADNRLPWPQLHEAGGLDGRLANEMGILTLPTMILVDKNGRVVRRNIHAGELEAELRKVVK